LGQRKLSFPTTKFGQRYERRFNVLKLRTEARIALLSLSNIRIPWPAAPFDPRSKLPIDVIDSRSSEFFGVGRNVWPWMTGNILLNLVKYI
jgi:hypothetical protein